MLDRTNIANNIGIELEFMDIDRKSSQLIRDLRGSMDRIVEDEDDRGMFIKHDASCESPEHIFMDHILKFLPSKSKYLQVTDIFNDSFKRRQIVGGELVTPILNTNTTAYDWKRIVMVMTDTLVKHKENPISTRGSLHVHINVTKNASLEVLKNLLRLIIKFEYPLYKLGGMGSINRGNDNNYCYQRPYSGNGIPVVRHGDYYYHCFVLDDLFASSSVEEFFQKLYNANDHYSNGSRYVAERYMLVNFYSVLTYGSIEFRSANKTLNPEYIIAWVEFCQAIVKLALSVSTIPDSEDFPMSTTKTMTIEQFDSLLDMLSLEKSTRYILHDIWNTSSDVEFDNKPRGTHLSRYPTLKEGSTLFTSKAYYNPSEIEPASFTDVHMLNRKSGGKQYDVVCDTIKTTPNMALVYYIDMEEHLKTIYSHPELTTFIEFNSFSYLARALGVYDDTRTIYGELSDIDLVYFNGMTFVSVLTNSLGRGIKSVAYSLGTVGLNEAIYYHSFIEVQQPYTISNSTESYPVTLTCRTASKKAMKDVPALVQIRYLRLVNHVFAIGHLTNIKYRGSLRSVNLFMLINTPYQNVDVLSNIKKYLAETTVLITSTDDLSDIDTEESATRYVPSELAPVFSSGTSTATGG